MASPDKVIEQLNAKMGIPHAVRFEAGNGGLVRAVLTAADAPTPDHPQPASRGEAHVYLHGAHVSHFQPAGQPPVFFMSKESRYETGKAIRGGVPICFPWFGPKKDDPKAAMHGFARDRNWKFQSVERAEDGSVTVVLVLKYSAATQALWPPKFSATLSVTLDGSGRKLTLALAAKNLDAADLTLEAALHTYIAVSDVNKITVAGLENTDYIDKVDNFARKKQPAEPIRITGETDRVFLNTTGTCVVNDPGGNGAPARRVIVEKEGSKSTVVWNPWINKAKAMADFGDDEWPGMVCVETANVGDNAVTIKPRTGHVMKAIVRVE